MPTSDDLVTSVGLHTDDILTAIVQCIAAPHEVPLLDVLSTLPALDDLELSRCCFDPTRPRPLFPKPLPRGHFSDMAWPGDAWSVLGVALASAHGLNELSWHSCCSSTTALMATITGTIPNWIERGANSISFTSGDKTWVLVSWRPRFLE
ncbi:hypothetical protein SPRG_11013 [Saprolegnia parasitica CBS 223.65]|uniref:Uncharacterized protein n=1 Tax=Saprolegnia parasitica (strain CBS 223.65) TaxID=695850 RepID=A0A067BWS9_SAPPC|nr:hypothetical protein SPRG_11013 [Saprolegnia parasitica CBS 223.65]KDO22698.1 hypothetical protein SPRG_11013 [Saprolegnia parasitica CBS 223.65]|eukprot:XP_012206609.1 hypothetical protein SPRG_11013 [Saprolegnia parasitica CBS 223.65]